MAGVGARILRVGSRGHKWKFREGVISLLINRGPGAGSRGVITIVYYAGIWGGGVPERDGFAGTWLGAGARLRWATMQNGLL
jgi:hypothetical protein